LLAALPDAEFHHYLENAKLQKFTPNTVTSKVKLRELVEETRLRGWSIVDQELEISLRSISVPIRDRDGKVVAALNVCCPAERVTPQDISSRILSAMLEASKDITRALQA
jgi:IclR family pca regulon transcriptional regulator